ncbi:MAG: Glyoxylate/hydroxypyruvate reductase B [Syntrophaceae bacterium PtaU1.Bin231]|nr:MAG: Glyoxylate/hydroxypyruvate reductase B [Syntrophaceae bacterium PtaU1.Bin231]HOG17407.1 D-glycerate dehydrogenase [Syntrophales bacterium]
MKKPKVFVTRILPEEGLNRVLDACDAEVWREDAPPPPNVLMEKVRGVDGLLSLLTDRIDGQLLDAAGPTLKVVSNFAVGYDNIDVPAATERGILVGNTPGVLTETTADLAFALLMAAARRLPEGADFVRAGLWTTFQPMLMLGRDIHGASLGIVGMGQIGRAMAKRAAGFDMKILYYDPFAPADVPLPAGAIRCTVLDELLGRADFVSLHVPLGPQTHHLIGRRALGAMKPTAILVNASRGPVVDPDALYEALQEGRIAGAALDVTEPEPLPADHRLLTLKNCLVVPHIGSATHATRTRMAVMAAENLIAGLTGKVPPHPVNPEVLPRRR